MLRETNDRAELWQTFFWQEVAALPVQKTAELRTSRDDAAEADCDHSITTKEAVINKYATAAVLSGCGVKIPYARSPGTEARWTWQNRGNR